MRPTRDIAWESRQLPQSQQQFTFRGRYQHLDKELCKILALKRHEGRTLRILDVGCGVMSFGSPTLHHLYDELAGLGVRPVVVGVDKHIPNNLNPINTHICYARTLEEVTGVFDIVRILHVVEHLEPDVYIQLRDRLLEYLRTAGIFIATQVIMRSRFNKLDLDTDWSRMAPTIKIAQKMREGLLAIDLLPDMPIPDWVSSNPELEGTDLYKKYRELIASGKEDVPTELCLDDFNATVSWLLDLKLSVLGYEIMNQGPGSVDFRNWWSVKRNNFADYFRSKSVARKYFWKHHQN